MTARGTQSPNAHAIENGWKVQLLALKDGHHPIIFMQCGPVRYRVDAKSQGATRPFSHKVTIRETGFRLAPELESQSPTQITAIYAALAKDEKRNDRISTMY